MRTAVTEFMALDPPRRTPRPLFAVGDLHGHADAAAAMLDHLRRTIVAEYGDDAVDLVYLGDYIDRGPDPLGVLALVRDGLGLSTTTETALTGNHDRFLASAAQLGGLTLDMRDWSVWLANGGRETLNALGGLGYMSATPERLRAELGVENAAFLEGLQLSVRFGDVLCVHAGVDPDVGLEAQADRDLYWMREPFLSRAETLEALWAPQVLVIHGHTPGSYGVFPHRIGVDTGGYATGVFSAVELRDGAARFHHVMR